jgi:hypothetical protein
MPLWHISKNMFFINILQLWQVGSESCIVKADAGQLGNLFHMPCRRQSQERIKKGLRENRNPLSALVGADRFELSTSSVSGKRSPPELRACMEILLFSTGRQGVSRPKAGSRSVQVFGFIGFFEFVGFVGLLGLLSWGTGRVHSMHDKQSLMNRPSCRSPGPRHRPTIDIEDI